MSVLFIAVPVALLTSLVAVLAFVQVVRTGQFDDLDTPAQRMLFDDVECVKPKAAAKTADSPRSQSADAGDEINGGCQTRPGAQ